MGWFGEINKRREVDKARSEMNRARSPFSVAQFVERCLELKAVEALLPVHRSQLLSYLRLGGFKLGYLLNFNVAQMRDGIVRMVNGL